MTIIYNASLLLTGKYGENNISNGWIQIEGSRICGLGEGDSYKENMPEDATLIDANGKSVLPGFIDNHFHVITTALGYEYPKLDSVSSFEEIGEIIQNVANNNDAKIIIGVGLDDANLVEKRLPTRTVLDKYCNNLPLVLITKDYHTLILNTTALLYFKVPFGLKGVEMDEMDIPTGIFTNQAAAKMDKIIIKSHAEKNFATAVEKLFPRLLQCGITSLAAMEGGNVSNLTGNDLEADFLLRNKKQYPVDIEVFYQTTDIDRILSLGLKRIGGALYLDGTMGSHTAAFSYGYSDEKDCHGVLFFSQEELNEFVARCCAHNLQVAFDAIGDSAIEMALIAFELAAKKYDVPLLRHRIEHAEAITLTQIKRAAKLGVVLSMQPTYEGIWGFSDGMYQQRLGKHYGETNQLRRIVDEGVIICGGSDSDVTSYNPFEGIHWCVNHPIERHRIELLEALRLYTYNGAFALKLETEIGSLYQGKRADIIMLNCDVLATEKSKLHDVKVDLTIKDGQIMFDRREYARD